MTAVGGSKPLTHRSPVVVVPVTVVAVVEIAVNFTAFTPKLSGVFVNAVGNV